MHNSMHTERCNLTYVIDVIFCGDAVSSVHMNPALVAPMNVMTIVNALILLVPLNVNVKLDLPKIRHPKSLASMLMSV